MRPEWLISSTASGRASAGQRLQWLATCCATNDDIEMPPSATLPPKRPRAQAMSSADLEQPARRSGRASRCGASGEERLAAIEARHGAQPVIGRDRLDHPPAHRGQPPAGIVRQRQQLELEAEAAAQDQRLAGGRPAGSTTRAYSVSLPGRARSSADGVGARSQHSRKPSCTNATRHLDRARIERYLDRAPPHPRHRHAVRSDRSASARRRAARKQQRIEGARVMRWRVAAARRRRSSAPGSASPLGSKIAALPSLRAPHRPPAAAGRDGRAARANGSPDQKAGERADLLAEQRRVGAGLIGGGPQPRQRQVPAPEPEQARPGRPRVSPAGRPSGDWNRTFIDRTPRKRHHRLPATPIEQRSAENVGQRPGNPGSPRSDDGVAGRRAPRPQRGRLQPFQHGGARPRRTCSWSIRRACTGRRSRRLIW